MRRISLARARSLFTAAVLAALTALGTVATVLADGGNNPWPK